VSEKAYNVEWLDSTRSADGYMLGWSAARNEERVTVGKIMAVFQYTAAKVEGESLTVAGTVVGRDETVALARLNQHGYSNVRLTRISGIAALWKRFAADIK
jgi:hypothetical protein